MDLTVGLLKYCSSVQFIFVALQCTESFAAGLFFCMNLFRLPLGILPANIAVLLSHIMIFIDQQANQY